MTALVGVVSEKEFDLFYQEYQTLRDEDLDPRMVAVVRKFNTLPNIVTRFCCSGHYKKERPNDYSCTPHLIFVSKADINSILLAFQCWVNTLQRERWLILRPSISLVNLALLEAPFFYWAWKIEFSAKPHNAGQARDIQTAFLDMTKYIQGVVTASA